MDDNTTAGIVWTIIIIFAVVVGCQDRTIYDLKMQNQKEFEKKYYDPCEYVVNARPRHCR